jgi:hypothetical protein
MSNDNSNNSSVRVSLADNFSGEGPIDSTSYSDTSFGSPKVGGIYSGRTESEVSAYTRDGEPGTRVRVGGPSTVRASRSAMRRATRSTWQTPRAAIL